MSSRSLLDLNPQFQPHVQRFLEIAAQAGLDVLIYCTLRLFAEQTQLYAIGRTEPGKIVTNAKAGESAHNYGFAIDGAPLIQGRIAWDDHAHWQIYGEIAESIGLEWAGSWVHMPEFPHIQLPKWRSYVHPATQTA